MQRPQRRPLHCLFLPAGVVAVGTVAVGMLAVGMPTLVMLTRGMLTVALLAVDLLAGATSEVLKKCLGRCCHP